MAIIDPLSDVVVIRIIYDGAPLSGKTTTVRALAHGLRAEVETPSEEDGRTVYFDWLEYTGGLFEGRRIRCQIISVPGQTTLAPRRRRLIEGADAVVFVGDSSPKGAQTDRAYLRGLCGLLARRGAPVPGVVLQANKRDHPDALPTSTLSTMLDELGLRIAVVESVATEGIGVREAFIFAVRLALDRVRELMRLGQLPTMQPTVTNADELLQHLRQSEGSAMDLANAALIGQARLADLPAPANRPPLAQEKGGDDTHPKTAARDDVASERSIERDDKPPALPDESVPSGCIWPPVDGRIVLREFAQSNAVAHLSAEKEWGCTVPGRWRVRSPLHALFWELERGREALIQLAGVYSTRGLAATCCVVLAENGQGQLRLWEITRLTPDHSAT